MVYFEYMNSINGYTPIFSTLVISSSVWQQSKEVKVLWVTMLALVQKDSVVRTTIPALANLAGLTIPECLEALNVLQSPDPFSTSKEHEGRRVLKVDDGFLIVNHSKYREAAREYSKKISNANSQARFRQKIATRSKPSPKEMAFVKAQEEGLTSLSDHLSSPVN